MLEAIVGLYVGTSLVTGVIFARQWYSTWPLFYRKMHRTEVGLFALLAGFLMLLLWPLALVVYLTQYVILYGLDKE